MMPGGGCGAVWSGPDHEVFPEPSVFAGGLPTTSADKKGGIIVEEQSGFRLYLGSLEGNPESCRRTSEDVLFQGNCSFFLERFGLFKSQDVLWPWPVP